MLAVPTWMLDRVLNLCGLTTTGPLSLPDLDSNEREALSRVTGTWGPSAATAAINWLHFALDRLRH